MAWDWDQTDIMPQAQSNIVTQGAQALGDNSGWTQWAQQPLANNGQDGFGNKTMYQNALDDPTGKAFMDLRGVGQTYLGTPDYQKNQNFQANIADPTLKQDIQQNEAYKSLSPDEQRQARTTGQYNGVKYMDDATMGDMMTRATAMPTINDPWSGGQDIAKQVGQLYSDQRDAKAHAYLDQDTGGMSTENKQWAADDLSHKTFNDPNGGGKVVRPEGDQEGNIVRAWEHRGVAPNAAVANWADTSDALSDYIRPKQNLQAIQMRSGSEMGMGGGPTIGGKVLGDASQGGGGPGEWNGVQPAVAQQPQTPNAPPVIWGQPETNPEVQARNKMAQQAQSAQMQQDQNQGKFWAGGQSDQSAGQQAVQKALGSQNFVTPTTAPMSYKDNPVPLDPQDYYKSRGVQQIGQPTEQLDATQGKLPGLMPNAPPPADYSQPGMQTPELDSVRNYGQPGGIPLHPSDLPPLQTTDWHWGARPEGAPSGTQETLADMKQSKDPTLRNYSPEGGAYRAGGSAYQSRNENAFERGEPISQAPQTPESDNTPIQAQNGKGILDKLGSQLTGTNSLLTKQDTLKADKVADVTLKANQADIAPGARNFNTPLSSSMENAYKNWASSDEGKQYLGDNFDPNAKKPAIDGRALFKSLAANPNQLPNPQEIAGKFTTPYSREFDENSIYHKDNGKGMNTMDSSTYSKVSKGAMARADEAGPEGAGPGHTVSFGGHTPTPDKPKTFVGTPGMSVANPHADAFQDESFGPKQRTALKTVASSLPESDMRHAAITDALMMADGKKNPDLNTIQKIRDAFGLPSL